MGWFSELPAPDQIKDYEFFQKEENNIPCKNRPKYNFKFKDDAPKEPKKELTYSF